MDKLKSNSYRYRSFSNQGIATIQNTQNKHHNLNQNFEEFQNQQQQQLNSILQQQQSLQNQYPSYDSVKYSKQQECNRRTSLSQLKASLGLTNNNMQEINKSISVVQNYRPEFNSQKGNSPKNNNQNDSFQSSLALSNQISYWQLNQSQNMQFCKNFIEFLNTGDSHKWIQITKYFDELQDMVIMKLQHSQIYDRSQKILQFITLNAEFIPKKFDILMSCVIQEFQNLREFYTEIQELIVDSRNIQNADESDKIYEKWQKQILSISDQYYKILTRHIQQFSTKNQLILKKCYIDKEKKNQNKFNQSQNIFDQHNQSNQSYINQTFNVNNNKENIPRGITLEDYQKMQRERILDKYSNENTLNLKIQQLEKQVRQYQSMLQARSKEFDICKQEKSKALVKIEELENKLHDLEKSIQFTDPSRFSSLRTGESEYLIKRHEIEKNELRRIIEQKNQEIKSYRIELEGILGEIEITSRRNANQNPNN
ncbi:hypothetical protein ABPG72_016042 [Tetrahymena utriculariae]